MISPIVTAARIVVLVMLAVAGLMALGSWAVTSRRISPFSGLARAIRQLTDPLFEPLERTLVRRGGNPRNAPWWLLGTAIGAGIAIFLLAQWVAGAVARSGSVVRSGPWGVVQLVVYYAGRSCRWRCWCG
jgi:hypothetical protein